MTRPPPKKEDNQDEAGAIRRMDKALKAALKSPPRKQKDQPKRANRV
jgi:hypothetical protein